MKMVSFNWVLIMVYYCSAVKLWHAVHIHGNRDLQMVTFSGQKAENVRNIGICLYLCSSYIHTCNLMVDACILLQDSLSDILPLPASTELSMERWVLEACTMTWSLGVLQLWKLMSKHEALCLGNYFYKSTPKIGRVYKTSTKRRPD